MLGSGHVVKVMDTEVLVSLWSVVVCNVNNGYLLQTLANRTLASTIYCTLA